MNLHLKYLGGKTDYNKYVHVYFLTEYAKIDGWFPKEDKLEQMLNKDENVYVVPTIWGYHVYEVVSAKKT